METLNDDAYDLQILERTVQDFMDSSSDDLIKLMLMQAAMVGTYFYAEHMGDQDLLNKYLSIEYRQLIGGALTAVEYLQQVQRLEAL